MLQSSQSSVEHSDNAAEIEARTLAVSAIGLGLRERMYALFSSYYDCVSREQFDEDLDAKEFVILLETDEDVVGFTTALTTDHQFEAHDIRVVFSGDTVVDHRHWGQQVLARAWLSEMGRLAREAAPRRLYWLLIVKGHRTYRYLPTFALHYVPARDGEAGFKLARLRDALARKAFGSHYDAATGIVRFPNSRGQLRPQWVEPSERELRLPDVDFFIQANPGFRNGDELACLTEIARENMKRLARRWFDEGFHGR